QNAPEPRRGGELHVSAHLRLPLELRRERCGKLRRLDAECRQHARNDASGLVHERGSQVLDIELGVALVARLLLRGDERLLRLLRQFVRVNHSITFNLEPFAPLEQMAPDVLPAARFGDFARKLRYASPGGPPPTPGLPWPARRMRWPSFTPGGIFTVSRLAGWPFSREIWITCSDPLYASGRVISTSPSTSSPCLARDRVRVRVRPNTSSASPKPPFAAWPKRVRKKSENPLASSPNGLSPGCPVYTYWKPPVPEGRPRPCANCSHSGPTVSYRFRFSGSLRTS